MIIKQLSTVSCPPCRVMKTRYNDLDVDGFDYEYVDLYSPGEIERMEAEGTPHFKNSVPQFYIDGEPFQGSTGEAMDLFDQKIKELKNEGDLDEVDED